MYNFISFGLLHNESNLNKTVECKIYYIIITIREYHVKLYVKLKNILNDFKAYSVNSLIDKSYKLANNCIL